MYSTPGGWLKKLGGYGEGEAEVSKQEVDCKG